MFCNRTILHQDYSLQTIYQNNVDDDVNSGSSDGGGGEMNVFARLCLIVLLIGGGNYLGMVVVGG